MSTVFWTWVVLGVVFALAESIKADLFMLPWSAGALIAAVLEALHASSRWQWIAFFGLPSAIIIVTQRAIRRKQDAESGPRGVGPLS